MSVMDKEAYEERYGEKVIYCRVHHLSGIDSCLACEDEIEKEIGEEEMVKTCLTCAYQSEYEDDFISVEEYKKELNLGNSKIASHYILCQSCYEDGLQVISKLEEQATERLVYAINTDYLD